MNFFSGLIADFAKNKLTLFIRSAMVYGEYAFIYGVKLKQQTCHWGSSNSTHVYDLPTNRGHFPSLSCLD